MSDDLVSKEYKRRYVGRRESMAYVLFDSSKSFHIDEFKQRFILDVVKIDLDLNAMMSMINGIWDVVNDSFLGVLIDKTHTRWGKFRPFMFMYSTFGCLLMCVYWAFPLFFGKDPTQASKIICWLALAMLQETVATLHSISETGLLASITPNPDDRVRMYTQAEVISSIWESIPQITMGLLIDLVNHNKFNVPIDSVYVTMGIVCSLSSALLGISLSIYSKERISKPMRKTNYREGMRTIFYSRPMLIMLFSEILNFSVGTATYEHNYYIDVLGSESYRNLITIPGAPLSFVSYAYINALRKKVPTKVLWILGQNIKDFAAVIIFAVGSVGGKAHGLYKSVGVMLPMLMARDILYKGTLSINKIIPKEIMTDALDFCEWKFGYRTEGVTLATKGMISKAFKNVINSFATSIMKHTGYSLNAGFGNQSDDAKYALFVMSVIMPAAGGLLSSIPKFFYDLSGEKKTRMYEELSVQRAIKSKEYKDAQDKIHNVES